MPLDDDRLARASRLLRRKHGLRQVDLVTPGRSIHFVRDLEAGRVDKLAVGDVRRHFARFGASARLTVWWNGAALDRLLDEDHSAVVEGTVTLLSEYGWRPLTEVTFAEYGERGSYDVLAARESARAVFVGEAKSDWGSLEETLRRLDVKVRLAPEVCRKVFGFTPAAIGAALIFPDATTVRRVARRRESTLSVAVPARGRDIRRWLREPRGPMRGLWFLSDVRLGGLEERRQRR